jgi:hypothetical protein
MTPTVLESALRLKTLPGAKNITSQYMSQKNYVRKRGSGIFVQILKKIEVC